MGVMGLGENGPKVPGALDMAISSPPPQYDKRGMEHVRQDSRPKNFLVAYPKP